MAGKSSKARNKGRGVSAARPNVAEPEKRPIEAAMPANDEVAALEPTDISSGAVESNSPEQAPAANGSVAEKVDTVDAPPETSKQNEGGIHLYPVSVKSQTGEKLELQLSPGDSVMDIRQFLLDAPETCFFTCYDLILHAKDGRVHHLEDYNEIAEVADITTGGCFIEMLAALYDDRSIRSHVRRARDLLSTGTHHASLSTLLALQNETKQESDVVKADLPELEGLGYMDDITGSLGNLITSSCNNVTCIDSIVFSSFNPPPSYRRLDGDLIYIDVTTLEGTKFCITGSTKSFYVNSSTGSILEPRPNKQFSEATTLIGLLQKLSSKFKKGFREILERKASLHPFENVQSLLPPNMWLGQHPTPDHRRDAARAEDAFVLSYGTELIGMQRDWNEELQSCREFPHNTLQERILRDRALYKVSCDFVDAATNGAIGVINRCISPINPTDPECFHMYVHNNIFFSFAVDTDIRQTLKDQASCATLNFHHNAGNYTNSGYDSQEESPSNASNSCCQSTACKSDCTIDEQHNGTHSFSDASTEAQITDGEQATYASANNDLKGTKAYQEVDVSGLYNLAMAIIDYRGHRIVAQSIIPGILQGDKSDSLLYGSVDNGKKISWNDTFHSKVLEAAKRLHIKEHMVLDGLGNAVKLAAPVECKGIVGSDGRNYLLDLMRVTPRDANYVGPGFRFCVLRPELVASFCQVEAAQKHKTSIGEAPVTSSEDVNNISSKDTETDDNTVLSEERSNPAPGRDSEEILLNPNVFTEFKISGTEEEIASDEAAVRKAGSYLMNVVLPKFVQDLCSLEVSPMDGQTLTDALHAHGINIRYLGRVANMTKHLPHLWDLCTAEIIVRAAKHLLKEVLRESHDHDIGSAITHFLNCFLGRITSDAARGGANNLKAQKKDQANYRVVQKSARKIRNAITRTIQSANMFPTSDSLWCHIQEFSTSKYQFELPEDARVLVKKVSVVRNLCLKVGISIAARKYDLDGAVPFQMSDILNLQPVVKHSVPVSSEARDLIEKGKACLAEGMLNEAYTIFSEAFSLLQQVTGPMHREVANCCRYLAMVLYHAGDKAGAIMQQHKELIINERCLGLDHPDTAHSYGNMALFYHGLNQTELALRHMSRTLLLLSLSSGADHPDVAATFINVAMMYQDIGKMNTALRYLQEALKKNERLLGPEHIQTAVCYHALAIAFNCMGAYKLSHQHEKKTYDIFVKQLGEEDSRTRDAENWIMTFKMRDLQVNAQKQKAHSVSASSAQKAIDLLKAHPDLLQVFQAAAANSSSASFGEVHTKGRGVDLRAARATAEVRKRAASKGLVQHGTPVQAVQPLAQLLDIINAGATGEAVNVVSPDDFKKENNHDTIVSENGFTVATQDNSTSLESKKEKTPAGLGVGLKERNPNKKLQHD